MRELQSGTLLQGGKYRIDKSLGQGGFGITYLAEQTNLNRKICIKEFFMKEYGERTESTNTDADATVLTGVSAVTSAAAEIMGRYREKFVKEARTIARLDHPGIVRIHDVFEESGTAYYVMDFIEGDNLNDMLKREGPLSEDRALRYIRQIADALSYVHSRNIMHLDVKPANVLIRKSDDKAILIDFGTAKQYDSEGTQTSTTPIGLSAGYAPIEMTKPGGVQTFSPETDVYSLGATLYYLVTGQNPPDASELIEMIMEGETLHYPGNISQTVIAAIEQALQTRKKRPQTVAAFLELLPAIKPERTEKKNVEFCPNCGDKLNPNAKFCPGCGSKIENTSLQEKSKVLTNNDNEHMNQQQKKVEQQTSVNEGKYVLDSYQFSENNGNIILEMQVKFNDKSCFINEDSVIFMSFHEKNGKPIKQDMVSPYVVICYLNQATTIEQRYKQFADFIFLPQAKIPTGRVDLEVRLYLGRWSKLKARTVPILKISDSWEQFASIPISINHIHHMLKQDEYRLIDY